MHSRGHPHADGEQCCKMRMCIDKAVVSSATPSWCVSLHGGVGVTVSSVRRTRRNQKMREVDAEGESTGPLVDREWFCSRSVPEASAWLCWARMEGLQPKCVFFLLPWMNDSLLGPTFRRTGRTMIGSAVRRAISHGSDTSRRDDSVGRQRGARRRQRAPKSPACNGPGVRRLARIEPSQGKAARITRL